MKWLQRLVLGKSAVEPDINDEWAEVDKPAPKPKPGKDKKPKEGGK